MDSNLFVKVRVSLSDDFDVTISLQEFFSKCSKDQSLELQMLSYRRDGISKVEDLYSYLTPKQKLDLYALLKIEEERAY